MIELYTKPNCSYCNKAKRLLRDKQIGFNEHKLDVDFTREFIQEKYSTAQTFPVVVIDGFYVGGFTELEEYLKQQTSQQFLIENRSL